MQSIEYVSETKEFIDGDNIRFEVVINCVVLKYSSKPDPKYKVEIKGIKPFYYVDDFLTFSVNSTQDSWLSVFCIPQNQENAYFLFPNDYEQSFLLLAERTYNFPMIVDFVQSIEGTEQQTDRIIMVLTKEKYPFTGKITYQSITEWIFSISPDQRIVESFGVSIAPKEK